MTATASSTSVRIEWMPPALKDRNGAIVGYTVVLTNSETMEQFTYNVEMLSFQVERMFCVLYEGYICGYKFIA